MGQTTNQKGIDLIKSFEGCVLHAYKDAVGVWTIGYGTTRNVQPGMIISQDKAEELLKVDLKRFEDAVNRTGIKLNTNQFSALVSFTYNLGEGNLQTLVRGRTLTQIANNIPLYNKAGGQVLRGLVRRREAEKALFLTPVPKQIAKVYYIVKKGDTFGEIAQDHKLSIARLKELNPDVKNINIISIGQRIRIK